MAKRGSLKRDELLRGIPGYDPFATAGDCTFDDRAAKRLAGVAEPVALFPIPNRHPRVEDYRVPHRVIIGIDRDLAARQTEHAPNNRVGRFMVSGALVAHPLSPGRLPRPTIAGRGGAGVCRAGRAGASRIGDGDRPRAGLAGLPRPMTQMATVANTKMAAHRIPMPSQNFAVVMAPHVTNNKDIVSTYANESAESLFLARKVSSLSCFFDSRQRGVGSSSTSELKIRQSFGGGVRHRVFLAPRTCCARWRVASTSQTDLPTRNYGRAGPLGWTRLTLDRGKRGREIRAGRKRWKNCLGGPWQSAPTR